MKSSRILSVVLAVTPLLASAQNLSILEQWAIEAHPMMKAAQTDVETAEWRAELLQSPYRPSVSLNGYLTSGTGTPIYPSSVMPVNYARMGPDTFGAANIMLMWPLLYGGRAKTSAELGQAMVAEAEQQLQSTMRNIVFDLRKATADTLYAREYLEAVKANRDAALQIEKDAELREEAGSAPHAFTLRARAAARKAEGDVKLAESKLAQAEAKLRQAASDTELDPDSVVWNHELEAPTNLTEALETATERRPEMAVLEAKIKQQGLQATISKQSEKPELSFMAMGDLMDGSQTSFDEKYKFGLVVSIPLLDGGKRTSDRKAKEAMTESLTSLRDNLKLIIRQEVESAWAEWEASEAVLASARAAVEAGEESYRTELLRFRNGKSILAELLDSQESLLTSQAALADAVRYRRVAWSKLINAMGVFY